MGKYNYIIKEYEKETVVAKYIKISNEIEWLESEKRNK